MPTFITSAWNYLLAAIPYFIAFGAVTTAVNQFVQKVIAPRWPRVGSIVNTITVDYAALLAELGAIVNMGPRSEKAKLKRAIRASVRPGLPTLMVMLSMFGCAAVGVWSPAVVPDVAILCAITGDVLPQLEALAAQYGVPLWFLEDAYAAACGSAAKDKPDEAKQRGLSAASAAASAASKAKLTFPKDRPQ